MILVIWESWRRHWSCYQGLSIHIFSKQQRFSIVLFLIITKSRNYHETIFYDSVWASSIFIYTYIKKYFDLILLPTKERNLIKWSALINAMMFSLLHYEVNLFLQKCAGKLCLYCFKDFGILQLKLPNYSLLNPLKNS